MAVSRAIRPITTSSAVSVGFGNTVMRERIIAIVGSESAPIRRAIQDSRQNGRFIDATQGHRTRSVLFMDTGQLVSSGLARETLAKRLGLKDGLTDSGDNGA